MGFTGPTVEIERTQTTSKSGGSKLFVLTPSHQASYPAGPCTYFGFTRAKVFSLLIRLYPYQLSFASVGPPATIGLVGLRPISVLGISDTDIIVLLVEELDYLHPSKNMFVRICFVYYQ